MDAIPLIALLFYAVPEGILSNTIGLTLMSVRPRFKQMVILGMLFALTAYLSRRFIMVPVLHSIVITLCVSVYLTFLYRIGYKKALIAALLAWVFVTLGEVLFIPVVLSFTGLIVQEVLANPWLRVLVTLPQQLLLVGVAIISYRLRGFHLDRYTYTRSNRSWGS
ncbi:MAG: hypothetical protein KGZ79_06390 [Dethiobacter sp.]|jgi:hypothetical protein|nr:hypothetical protein [Dethiobacter sp.]